MTPGCILPSFVQIDRDTKKFSLDCNLPGRAAGLPLAGGERGPPPPSRGSLLRKFQSPRICTEFGVLEDGPGEGTRTEYRGRAVRGGRGRAASLSSASHPPETMSRDEGRGGGSGKLGRFNSFCDID